MAHTPLATVERLFQAFSFSHFLFGIRKSFRKYAIKTIIQDILYLFPFLSLMISFLEIFLQIRERELLNKY